MVPDIKMSEILGPIVLAVVINVSPLRFGVVEATCLSGVFHPAASPPTFFLLYIELTSLRKKVDSVWDVCGAVVQLLHSRLQRPDFHKVRSI